MRDIITGLCLLFCVPSVFEFWRFFIHLEKTKQIDLSDDIKINRSDVK